MHETSTFIGIVADILAIIGLIYVVLQIKRSESKVKKSQLTIKFERFKREKMLRNALVILAFSFIFSFFTVYGAVFHPETDEEEHNIIVEYSYVISKVLLFMFVVYVLQTTRYASISTKGI